MKKFKVGDRVYDLWWPYEGNGVVKKVLKTRIRIEWNNGGCVYMTTFDNAHTKFLEKVKKSVNIRSKSL